MLKMGMLAGVLAVFAVGAVAQHEEHHPDNQATQPQAQTPTQPQPGMMGGMMGMMGQINQMNHTMGQMTAQHQQMSDMMTKLMQNMNAMQNEKDPAKLRAMMLWVEWTLHLGPSFPEVVETVWTSPEFKLKDSFLFRELADSKLPQQYPTATAKLLLKVLQNMQVAHYDLDKVEEIVRHIAPLQAPVDILNGICNELARLGYPQAAELQAWLQGRNA